MNKKINTKELLIKRTLPAISSVSEDSAYKQLNKSDNAIIFILAGSEKEAIKSLSDDLVKAFKVAAKRSSFKGFFGEYVRLDKHQGGKVFVIGNKSKAKDEKCSQKAKRVHDLGKFIFGIASKENFNEIIIDVNNFEKYKDRKILRIIETICLFQYRYDKFKSSQKSEPYSLKKIYYIDNGDINLSASSLKNLQHSVNSVYFARDLVTSPANYLYPKSYADVLVSVMKPLGIEVTVLDKKQLEKLGFGALLAVSQGSERDPFVVVMHWKGKKAKAPDLALVGKGVTFDTGGISLKPGRGMHDMKFDMAGSAAVCGAMMNLAKRKAKANVVGIVGLVENMPSHNAYRPGDVIIAGSGKTIEVQNTDAEGRLVLADLLWYAQSKLNAKNIINLATLTGAVIIALGHHNAGLFSNNDELTKGLKKSACITSEGLWKMPISPSYDEQINSDIADVCNVSYSGGGQSITAAQFLHRFIDEGTAWAHLDIAGTAWAYKSNSLSPKGATGFGVRLLNKYVENTLG